MQSLKFERFIITQPVREFMMKTLKLLSRLSLFVFTASTAIAEDTDTQADANNPLAFTSSVSFHNYYIGDLTLTDDETLGKYADQGIIRFAQPFTIGESRWIFRGSLNINNLPALDGYDTGLGDLNLLTSYLFDLGNPNISFGMGPLLNVPTATEDSLGSGKWSAGLANVYFNKTSPKF